MMIITRERLAKAIYNHVIHSSAYDDIDTLMEARRINETEGWTFETSAPLGGVLVTEGVRVSGDFLIEAHQYAIDHAAELVYLT